MPLTFRYILLSLLLGSGSSNIFACTCNYIEKISAEALIDERIVFTGKIIKLKIDYSEYQGKRFPSGRTATFVVTNWISSSDISDTVVVNTGYGGGDCGLKFEKRETWLIYANNQHGIVTSSICTPSIKSTDPSFVSSIEYLKRLKSRTGRVEEKIERGTGFYVLSGNVVAGKPVGQWLRISNNDTVAVFNFNLDGKRHGYQLEKDEDFDEIHEYYFENTHTYVKVYNSKKQLVVFYELKKGRRNGKFELYLNNIFTVKANYRNGKLEGEWTSWHEDSAVTKGKIRTTIFFENDYEKSVVRIDEATGKKL